MKKIILSSASLILLSATVLTTQSCKKSVPEVVQEIGDIDFAVNINEKVVIDSNANISNIPQLPPEGLTVPLPPIAAATNIESNLQQYNTSSNLIETVKLGMFHLTMEQPPGQNFDLVDSLWMYIHADGLDKKLAAYKFDIPKGTQKVEFDIEDLELKEYFIKDSIYVTLQGHFYEVPEKGTEMKVDASFDVTANPLNR